MGKSKACQGRLQTTRDTSIHNDCRYSVTFSSRTYLLTYLNHQRTDWLLLPTAYKLCNSKYSDVQVARQQTSNNETELTNETVPGCQMDCREKSGDLSTRTLSQSQSRTAEGTTRASPAAAL